MSSDSIVLTNATPDYTYQDYYDALRAMLTGDVNDVQRLVYADLCDAFRYEADSRNLDNLIMHIHAVLDEDDGGSAWEGAAARLVKRIREIIEDEDVREPLGE